MTLTLQHMDDMDLEMLAPYISMDDDFQLSVLIVPEEMESPALAPERRKRFVPPEILTDRRSLV